MHQQTKAGWLGTASGVVVSEDSIKTLCSDLDCRLVEWWVEDGVTFVVVAFCQHVEDAIIERGHVEMVDPRGLMLSFEMP